VTLEDQIAGGYWVTETSVAGYSHTAKCEGGATGASSVILTLEPGDSVTCTFTHVAEVGAMYRLFAPLVVNLRQ